MGESMENFGDKLITLDVLAHFLQRLDARYQQSEEGKGLSTNDFTDELKAKLDSMGTNAQAWTKRHRNSPKSAGRLAIIQPHFE